MNNKIYILLDLDNKTKEMAVSAHKDFDEAIAAEAEYLKMNVRHSCETIIITTNLEINYNDKQ